MPKRIQLSRKKGWRKPEGCIVVSSPSKWGNPFTIHAHGCAEIAVGMFRNNAYSNVPAALQYRNRVRRELGGADLACWCPLDQPCHADVLLEIANSPMESEASHDR